jgi:membrane fusion protein, multidrug efflux system
MSRPCRSLAPRVSVCVVLLLGVGCATSSAESERREQIGPESFPVRRPHVTDAAYEREFSSNISAVQHAEIRSRVPGVIQRVFVDEGQNVKAGDPLFALESQQWAQQLSKSRAETRTAEADYQMAVIERDNLQLLVEKKVISEAEMAVAKSKAAAALARVEESKVAEQQAATRLAYTTIRAPFDGVVNRIHYRLGSLVSEEELLTTLTNSQEVFVYFKLSEVDFLEYKAQSADFRSRQVALRLANGSRYPLPGVVDAVESEFDRATGNIAVRARFPNPDGVLKHGSSGKVLLENDLKGVVVVPQKSTFEVQGNLYVYAVDENNVPKAQRIVPRARLEDVFVVDSGLTEKDRFVLEGIQRVKEGVEIGISPQG